MSRNESKRSQTLLIAAVSYLVLACCSQSFAVKKWVDYDRLRAVEKFLDAVYSPLLQEKGLSTLQTVEFNSNSPTLDLFFTQCRPGSGVPVAGEKPPHPNCNGFIGSASSEFLHLSVQMGPAKFPIHHFYAQGTFVQEKRAVLLAEMKSHPEWKDPEMLELLQKAGATFGPENRDDFLKSVPATAIYEFSACRLDLRTATFSAGSYAWGHRV